MKKALGEKESKHNSERSESGFIPSWNTYLDFLLNVVIEQDVRVNAMIRQREWEGVESSALCGFLLGFLVSPLLTFQKDSLERRHNTRLVNEDRE